MKGYSIHIGVNKVDQSHYGDLTDLRAAVFDAEDMHKLSVETFGYENIAFLTNETATSKNILEAFSKANELCKDDDILFISYSGHGSTIEDYSPGITPDEAYDQTWCLYDRQLIDDEIKYAFSQFNHKVRILVVSDSCHSGSVVRMMPGVMATAVTEEVIPALNNTLSNFIQENDFIEKKLSMQKATSIQDNHVDFYKEILANTPQVDNPDSINASVLLLAACKDDEVTFDGRRNGKFTNSLKYVLDTFEITSPSFLIEKIKSYNNYPNPTITDYGSLSDFRMKGNPFFVIPNYNNCDNPTLNPIDDSNTNIDDPYVPNAPLVKLPNLIELSSESGALSLGILGQLYTGQIKSILSISSNSIEIEVPEEVNIWDAIHTISRNSDLGGYDIIAEPAKSRGFETQDVQMTRAAGSEINFMEYWPPFSEYENVDRNWHLDADHSQLALARDFVWNKIKDDQNRKPIRIAHLDTGWNPNHPLLKDNQFIRADLAKSFVKGEETTNLLGEDIEKGRMEQQGHGTGTLGLISGGHIDIEGKPYGKLGAAPFVEVIPIRVADSVIILNTKNIVEGIEYAIAQKCDVITMSLGGKPSRKLAQAINKAYEKGIVVVTAGGNCFVKGAGQLGPKKLIYPAKFDRVIAACGVTLNHKPYDFKAQEKESPFKSFNIRYMQGNWGPKKPMRTALAAYTPNVPWLTNSGGINFVQSGGGTSSATPQIASAAALWLACHSEELATLGLKGWKKVEAVRYALFNSANNDFEESEKYYGQGILKAFDALKIVPERIPSIVKSKKAIASPYGVLEAVDLFINRFRTMDEVVFTEKELASLSLELTYIIEELNIKELNDIASLEEGENNDIESLQKYKEQILTQRPSDSLIKLLGL